MTDQPLPLKPCPFCGKNDSANESIKRYGCSYCVVAAEKYQWQNAYCWKLLAAKEAEIAMLKESMLAQDRTHPWAKNQELEAEIEELKAVRRIEGIEGGPPSIVLNQAQYDNLIRIKQEQADTIKILTEALEIVARRKCFDSVFIHGKGFTVCICNEIGAEQTLDRVRGKETK